MMYKYEIPADHGNTPVELRLPDPCYRSNVLYAINRRAAFIKTRRAVVSALMVAPVVYAAVFNAGYISLAVMLLMIAVLHLTNCGLRDLAILLEGARRCAEGMDCSYRYDCFMLREVFTEIRNRKEPTLVEYLCNPGTLVMPVLCSAVCTLLVVL